MKDYVAVDVETANGKRSSICSISLIFVEEGKLVDEQYSLIDPEDEFRSFNTKIHGIRAEDVVGQPTFKEYYSTVKHRLEGKLLIAHNMEFDGSAIRGSLDKYGEESVESSLLCTYLMAKNLLGDKTKHNLRSMCDHYHIQLDNHHHALDDAKACAELYERLLGEYDISTLKELYDKTGIRKGHLSGSTLQKVTIDKFI